MTSLPSWAVPGRKVVCVRGGQITTRGRRPTCPYPEKGAVYTIRSTSLWGVDGVTIVLILSDRPNTKPNGTDGGWAIGRFRPVVSLEDDMLTFRSLLNTVPASKELTE